MKKGCYLISLGVLCVITSVNAQNEADALRYSNLTFGGTARFVSMGGAFGALGGDISTLAFNPAGIAVYRKNEITFTPSIYNSTTTSTFNGTTTSDSKLNFNFSNLGIVGTIQNNSENGSGWKSFNIGIGYNRTNNFHNRVLIQGDNHSSSILQSYVNSANANPNSSLDDYGDGLAYQAYLIDYDSIQGKYTSALPNGGMQQRKRIETSGAMAETDFSFGANYNDRLYLGATIGVPYITYTETTSYVETDVKDTLPNFKSFAINQNLTTHSTYGVNFKFGAIYRANDWLRLGAAVHTPTYYSVTDEYDVNMSGSFDKEVHDAQYSPSGSYDYNITTPMRLMGSAAFVIGKRGLLSADYEYLDYRNAALNSADPGVFVDANNNIHNKFKATTNIRLGGEMRFDPFAIRLGYALYGSPLNLYPDGKRENYTIGVGYKHEGFSIDLAYVLTQTKEYYYLYDPSLVNAATNSIQTSAFMLTFGFRY